MDGRKERKEAEEATAIAKSSESNVSASLVYWLRPSETFGRFRKIALEE